MDQHIVSSAGVKVPLLIYGTAWKENQTADTRVLNGLEGIASLAPGRRGARLAIGMNRFPGFAHKAEGLTHIQPSATRWVGRGEQQQR